jgi:protein-arginine kinase
VVLVNFLEHIEIVILPEQNNKNDSLREGLGRLLKVLQSFEKLGYATDPYLGNLTVDPRSLGTALDLEVSFKFESKFDHVLDKEVADEIEYGK